MKDFFENFGKRLEETAEMVTNKAGEAIEIQRVKSQIRDLARSNAVDMMELGKAVYERYKAGEELDEEAMALCDAVKDREKEIEKYERKIALLKGSAACAGCGKMVAKEMAYCPYCGTKMDIQDADEDLTEDYAKKMKEKVADAAETMEETAKDVKDAAFKAAEKAGETLEKAAGKAEGVVQDAVDKTVEAARKAVDVFRRAEERTEDTVRKTAETAAEAAEDVAEAAEDTVKKAAEAAAEAAEDVAEAAEDTVKKAAEAAEDVAEAQKIQ